MNAINPQAIAEGLGRPLTHREASALMKLMARNSGQRPKMPNADKPAGGFTPTENAVRRHLTGEMSADEIVSASGFTESAVNKALRRLEERKVVARSSTRKSDPSHTVQLWRLKTNLSTLQQLTLNAVRDGMTTSEVRAVTGKGIGNTHNYLADLNIKGMLAKGEKRHNATTWLLTAEGRAAQEVAG